MKWLSFYAEVMPAPHKNPSLQNKPMPPTRDADHFTRLQGRPVISGVSLLRMGIVCESGACGRHTGGGLMLTFLLPVRGGPKGLRRNLLSNRQPVTVPPKEMAALRPGTSTAATTALVEVFDHRAEQSS